MCFLVFVTLPYGALGQVWCLIVPIPDLCLLPYFTFITSYFNGFVLLKQFGNLTCLRYKYLSVKATLYWCILFDVFVIIFLNLDNAQVLR